MKPIVWLLFTLPSAFGAVGGSCTYNGLRGTCQKTSNCGQGTLTIDRLASTQTKLLTNAPST